MNSTTLQLSIKAIEELAASREVAGLRYGIVINPYVSLTNLANDMQESFRLFETNYPTNQSATVRRCLARIFSIIDSITKQALKAFDNDAQFIDKDLRLGCYQLFGLLVEQRLILEKKTGRIPRVLLTTIKSILYKNSLLHEPLTNIDYSDCYVKYLELVEHAPKEEKRNSHLRIMSKRELRKYEIQVYNDLLKITQSTAQMFVGIRIYHQVYADARKIIRKITALNPQKYLSGDLKIFINILKRMNDLLTEVQLTMGDVTPNYSRQPPWTEKALLQAVATHKRNAVKLCAEFKKFMRHVEYGKPSLHQAIAGVLTAFVGGILLLVSVSAKFFTLGLSAPLSTAGVALGLATILTGVGMFKMSRQRGVSKALSNLSNSLFTAFVAEEQAKQAMPDKRKELKPSRHMSLRNTTVYDDYW